MRYDYMCSSVCPIWNSRKSGYGMWYDIYYMWTQVFVWSGSEGADSERAAELSGLLSTWTLNTQAVGTWDVFRVLFVLRLWHFKKCVVAYRKNRAHDGLWDKSLSFC